MPDPLVSVIVPVYNTGEWLQEALDSIDRQTCRADVQVIVIDDGATDDSPEIARAYARRATAVEYVRQDNAGLGAARNRGLERASGRYLAFLDSDDIIPVHGLDRLVELAERFHADVVIGDMHGIPPRRSPKWRRELVTGLRTISSLGQAPDIVGNPSACNKLFRRDFVESRDTRFEEATAFEDVMFTLPLMLRSQLTVLTPDLVYLYRNRGDGSSIMDSRRQPAKIFEHLAVVERLMSDAQHADPGARRAVQRWVAYMQLFYAGVSAKVLDEGQLSEFVKRMSILYRDIPLEVTSEFVTSTTVGLRAVAIYEQDTAQLQSPGTADPLRVLARQVYAGHPALEHYRDLLRADPLQVDFTSLRRDRLDPVAVVVEGRCHSEGLSPRLGEPRADLLVEVGDTAVRRPLVVTRTTENWIHWICSVSLEKVPAGPNRLRLIVRDNGSEVAVPVSSVNGNALPVSLRGRRYVRLEARGGEPRLVVTGGQVAGASSSVRLLSRAVLGGAGIAATRVRTTSRKAAKQVLKPWLEQRRARARH